MNLQPFTSQSSVINRSKAVNAKINFGREPQRRESYNPIGDVAGSLVAGTVAAYMVTFTAINIGFIGWGTYKLGKAAVNGALDVAGQVYDLATGADDSSAENDSIH